MIYNFRFPAYKSTMFAVTSLSGPQSLIILIQTVEVICVDIASHLWVQMQYAWPYSLRVYWESKTCRSPNFLSVVLRMGKVSMMGLENQYLRHCSWVFLHILSDGHRSLIRSYDYHVLSVLYANFNNVFHARTEAKETMELKIQSHLSLCTTNIAFVGNKPVNTNDFPSVAE